MEEDKFKPTMQLRFIEELFNPVMNEYDKTLQQLFIDDQGNEEWRYIDIWEQQYSHNKPFTVSIDNCKRYFILIDTMAKIVKRAIEEDDICDKEYYPDKIFGMEIQLLFDSYLKYKGLDRDTCDIKWFNIPTNEKLCEVLDFNPEIVELDDIDDIVKIIEFNKKTI